MEHPKFEPKKLIKNAILVYMENYHIDGKKLIRPGAKSSTCDLENVYLRSGKHLMAIYHYPSNFFVELTPELTKKYSTHKK